MSDTLQNILDHAGSYYGWWFAVKAEDNMLFLSIAEEYAAELEGEPTSGNFNVTAVFAAVRKLRDTYYEKDSYEYRFMSDVLARRWDDADGDANCIDNILQTVLFGTPVFG